MLKSKEVPNCSFDSWRACPNCLALKTLAPKLVWEAIVSLVNTLILSSANPKVGAQSKVGVLKSSENGIVGFAMGLEPLFQ